MPLNLLILTKCSKIEEQEHSMKRSLKENRSIVGTFARFDQIVAYLNDVVSNNPDIASSYVAGKTHESRDLKVLVLKTPTSKRSIWIDCGIHAVGFYVATSSKLLLIQIKKLLFLERMDFTGHLHLDDQQCMLKKNIKILVLVLFFN